MIISKHAKRRMAERRITKEEIEKCMKEGRVLAEQTVKNETRYGRILELKNKHLVVVYTTEKNGESKIITCYLMGRERYERGKMALRGM